MFVHKVSFILKVKKSFMFSIQSAVKDNDSGKLVKFGYVVFAEKGTAQKVLREGYTTFQGHKIAVKEMK